MFQNISNLLFNIPYLFLSFLTILYLLPICNTTYKPTSNSYEQLSTSDIYDIIESKNIKTGECERQGFNCNYFPHWGVKNNFDRHELYCPSNNVCILTCENSDSCVNIDIQLDIDSTLIMACTVTNSCKSVSIYGNDASFIVLESNEINAITDSEIHCPLYNDNNTCIIRGECMDVFGHVHCDSESNIIPLPTSDKSLSEIHSDLAMIEHLSIYAYRGYYNVYLQCDFENGVICIQHSFILCGDIEYNNLQTCWIKYDIINDIYLCHGDNYYDQNMPLKCRDINNKINPDRLYRNNSTQITTTALNDASVNRNNNNNNNTNDNYSNEDDALISDNNNNNGFEDWISEFGHQNVRDIFILIIIILISICTCFCILCVCCKCKNKKKTQNLNENEKREFDFFQKQTQKQNEYNQTSKKNMKICSKCKSKSCLCYYLSCCCCCYCCYCLWNKSSPNNTSQKIKRQNTNHKNNKKHSNNNNNNKIEQENITNLNNIQEIETTIDDTVNEPQTINPLSIDTKGGIFPSFFIKNKLKTRNKIISPSISTNNTTVGGGTNTNTTVSVPNIELVIMNNNISNSDHTNNKLVPPKYHKKHNHQIIMNNNSTNSLNSIHKLTQQASLSSGISLHGHIQNHRQSDTTHTHTHTHTHNTINTLHNKRQSCSQQSHTSHHDGLEEQAAKKIGDAKLGINSSANITTITPTIGANITPFNNTPQSSHTPNDTNDLNDLVKNNNNVFGVAKNNNNTKNNDYKYALQLQQQQLFEAVQVMNDINTNTNGNTPNKDINTNGNNNNNTPHPTHNGVDTPNITGTTDGNPTIIEILPADALLELDIGGGFKIGIEESTTIHSTHSSISTSSSHIYDPEASNNIDAQNEYSYD